MRNSSAIHASVPCSPSARRIWFASKWYSRLDWSCVHCNFPYLARACFVSSCGYAQSHIGCIQIAMFCLKFIFLNNSFKSSKLVRSIIKNKNYVFKDYRYHDFPNTEFSYFLTIDTRQLELSNYHLKNGGHRPLKGRYDVICNDVIFH